MDQDPSLTIRTFVFPIYGPFKIWSLSTLGTVNMGTRYFTIWKRADFVLGFISETFEDFYEFNHGLWIKVKEESVGCREVKRHLLSDFHLIFSPLLAHIESKTTILKSYLHIKGESGNLSWLWKEQEFKIVEEVWPTLFFIFRGGHTSSTILNSCSFRR